MFPPGLHIVRNNVRLNHGCVVVLTCECAPAVGKDGRKPTGWVSDFAGVMQADVKQQLQSALTRLESMTEAEVAEIEERVTKHIEEAIAFAEASPVPPPEELLTDVYAES